MIYAGSMFTQNSITGSARHNVGIYIDCQDKDHAVGKCMYDAKHIYPEKDGWLNHTVIVVGYEGEVK